MTEHGMIDSEILLGHKEVDDRTCPRLAVAVVAVAEAAALVVAVAVVAAAVVAAAAEAAVVITSLGIHMVLAHSS